MYELFNQFGIALKGFSRASELEYMLPGWQHVAENNKQFQNVAGDVV